MANGGRAGNWPPALDANYRDFCAADLITDLIENKIDGTALVQSLPTDKDIHYLLDIADRTETVAAVVGWIDLQMPSADQSIAAFADHPKGHGLRPMLQDLLDDDWISRTALEPAVAAMVDHGLCFDALVFPRHLPAL
ncbi:amidohydrolase family protein [Candidatus Burkholderia verschuerenii]|uniref:amidohydrolase family protein n=1 Tax=Candidatus Burkholderia verschuerenii TaxID=242163 RepID=UPI001E5636C9|nr:hypothetical protein [Candidatus Burkholderia verschuerenii]